MKSLMMKKSLFYLVMVLMTAGLLSCGGTKKQEKASGEFDSAASSVQNQVKKVIYQVPPPSQIPYIIQATGADFNRSMVNSLDKEKKYLASNKTAALNLGVYATDIGYLVSYEQVQDALNYMKGCLDISDNLGLKSALDMAIVDRFRSNLNEKDSLANIINQAIANSDSYLRETDRDNMAALVVAGTFIEGLYIATQIVDTYPKNILPDDSRNLILTPMIRLIVDQQKPLEDLINLLKSIDVKGDWIDALINSLVELDNNYKELNIQDQIKNNRADLVLSDKTLAKITVQVNKIRTTVTY